MRSHEVFRPDWISAPGDTIADILRQKNLSVSEFAHHISETPEHTENLLEGRASITLGLARKLQHAIGGSVQFWMTRDFEYRQNGTRLNAADQEWVSELPIGDMVRFGWLRPAPHPSEETTVCLRFFGVPSVRVWHQVYANVQQACAFRTSSAFESRPAAVAAWLRQGEIESEAIACKPWNPREFKAALSRVRLLTREKEPGRFLPKLQVLCAEAGVAVVIVRAPNGCRASGATRFISPTKALLLLSFRYLSDDQFWFSFFHEAGHLLVHGEKHLFIESVDKPTSNEEQEANDFAASILVPPEFQYELLGLCANSREVIRFARRIATSPGIVVGQLQHYKKLTHRQLNSLKRRYEWHD